MMSYLPENISVEGKEVDFLFYIFYYLTGVTLFLVTAAMVIFLIKYRQKPGVKAIYTHGNTTLELIWTITPAVILLILLFVSQDSWARLKLNPPANPDLRIEVEAKQFNWIVRYPGPDGKFGTADDVKLDNTIHIPVGKQVFFSLKAKDVIHSFFIPAARVKQDVVPGRTTTVWFTPIKTGKYEIPCAELCGFGHSGMKGELIVHTPESYRKWVAETWGAKKPS